MKYNTTHQISAKKVSLLENEPYKSETLDAQSMMFTNLAQHDESRFEKQLERRYLDNSFQNEPDFEGQKMHRIMHES